MDPSTSTTPPAEGSTQLELGALPARRPGVVGLEELQRGVESARTLLHVTLISMILLSGSATVVLYQQVRHIRREMAVLRRGVSEYERLGKPRLEEFLNKLRDFARVNPDFVPIFSKYVPATNAPAASPTPALPPGVPATAPER